jgi:hypothetical protein
MKVLSMNRKLTGRTLRAAILIGLVFRWDPAALAQMGPDASRGLIAGIQEGAGRSPAEMARLREEALRRIEGPPVAGVPESQDPEAGSRGSAGACPKSHLPEILGISAALFFLAGMAILALYRRLATRRSCKSGNGYEGS